MKPMFPYFGGKSKIASEIWARFGDVPNYCEPFFGSGAVLFARPTTPQTETVNDKDRFLSNFWRAVQFQPELVAEWADWPVNEADLHARHLWLVNEGAVLLDSLNMESDPLGYDPQVAGWWWWGICQWIGSGWCSIASRNKDGTLWRARPHLGDAGGHGLNRRLGVDVLRPHPMSKKGINRTLPVGIAQIPHLGDAGLGPHRGSGTNGRHQTRADYILSLVLEAQERLRDVRVCCGDWKRILGPSPTFRLGTTAILLDPPYSHLERDNELYATDDGSVAAEVREWAIQNGDNPLLRIALCGYDTEHSMPRSWETLRWKAHGGYSGQSDAGSKARANAHRETIWFSPACLRPDRARQDALFEFATAE